MKKKELKERIAKLESHNQELRNIVMNLLKSNRPKIPQYSEFIINNNQNMGPKEYADFLVQSTKEAKEKSYNIVIVELCEHIFDLKDIKDIENKKEYLSKVRREIMNLK